MKLFLSAAIAALAVAGAANASIIPTLTGTTPDGVDTTFTYQGQLAPDQGVKDGNQLVIVDFAGYVPGTIHSPYANVSASISNSLPAGLILPFGVTDNPSIPDLVFTYTGSDYETSGGPFGSLTFFNGLSANSTLSTIVSGYFSAVAVKNNGPDTGTPAFNTGSVSVPGAVPEPATWAMMLFGIGLIGAGLRINRRQTATDMASI
jgi:hypothetical protein